MGFDKYYDKNLINQATMNLDEFIEKLKEHLIKSFSNNKSSLTILLTTSLLQLFTNIIIICYIFKSLIQPLYG